MLLSYFKTNSFIYFGTNTSYHCLLTTCCSLSHMTCRGCYQTTFTSLSIKAIKRNQSKHLLYLTNHLFNSELILCNYIKKMYMKIKKIWQTMPMILQVKSRNSRKGWTSRSNRIWKSNNKANRQSFRLNRLKITSLFHL